MKLVMPVGRNKIASSADFDVTPYSGCACSNVDGTWLTEGMRKNGGPGKPCQCLCAYGSDNRAANFSLGNNASEW